MKANRFALLWVLVTTLLLGYNAWLWGTRSVAPDTDILALLPVQERDPVLQRSFSHMVDFAQQRMVVLVGAPSWEDAKRASAAYRKVLSATPGVFRELAPMGNAEQDWLAQFKDHRLVLLTPEAERALREQGSDYWRDAALGRLYGSFGGPSVGSWRDDPFGLFTGWVQERAKETPVRPRDGLLFVGDDKIQYVLSPLELEVPAFSMTAQETALPLLARARAAALAAAPDADVVAAGMIVHAGEASATAEREMSTIGAGSIAGIILVTWLMFGTLRPVAMVLVSLVVGCLGAFTVSWLLFGSVHLMTLVFGASLIGVAQDYGIYFLCNRLSADPSLDSRTLLRRLMPGLVLTLLAAVIGYLGLAVTPFPGLRQMAVFSASGLVFAWLTVLAWFPALVKPGTLKHTRAAAAYGALLAHWPRLRLTRTTAVAGAMFAVLAAAGLARLHANDDIRLLQATPKHLVDAQVKLGRLLDAPSPVQYYVVRGDSIEQVLQREEALKARLDPLIGKSVISGYQAISNWVPSQERQQARRALLDRTVLADGGPLSAVGKQLGEDAGWAGSTAQLMRAGGAAPEVPAFLASAAGEPWRHLWLGESGGTWASIVALRGMRYAAIPELRAVATGMPGVQWADKVDEISTVLGKYRSYMGWVLAAAFGAILVLLWTRYRWGAVRVLAPAALACVGTLALLGWLGHSIALFHVLALLLVLGVGVDYGIFMQERPGSPAATAWLAVGMSAVNTILGFGLLALSRTPALQSFGLAMLVGILLVWLLVPFFRMTEDDTQHA